MPTPSPVTSLAGLLSRASVTFADRIALRVEDGDAWATTTYAELGDQVRAAAAALVDLGVAPGDRVVIFARNLPRWTVADFAIMTAGAIPVPIYQTSTPEQVRHIVRDSGARIAFVGGQEELGKISAVWDELGDLERVVTFAATSSGDERVSSLDEVLARLPGEATAAEVARRSAALGGDDLAAIIYTSGTTGDPKGVMLSHGALLAQVHAVDAMFPITSADHSLCFLPLSHALERAWTMIVLSHGCMNTYVPDPRTVADMLVRVRPTLLVSVPRLYEKVYAAAHEKGERSPLTRRIFGWALAVGGRLQADYRSGRRPSWVTRAQLPLADRLVLRNIREALGGPKTVLASGGAPLRREIEEFISATGVLLCQGYGLTEASPLVSFNAPGAFKFGTAGRPMAGSQIKVAQDGELFYRGPNVMTGYWKAPQATADAFVDGWLATGDIGYLDADDYLVITDRKKDLIVTSGGKNIAPGPIEGLLLADPLFEYAVVLGDNRPCLTLLVKPSLPHLTDLAEKLQVSFKDASELTSHPTILDEIHTRVQATTARLPGYEQVRDLRVLLEEFSQENGLLTPTLKVKRRAVEARFAHVVEDMYARLNDRRKNH